MAVTVFYTQIFLILIFFKENNILENWSEKKHFLKPEDLKRKYLELFKESYFFFEQTELSSNYRKLDYASLLACLLMILKKRTDA